MLQYVSYLDWFLLGSLVLVVLAAYTEAPKSQRIMKMVLWFLLFELLFQVLSLLRNQPAQDYSEIYCKSGFVECLLMSALAISLSSQIVTGGKQQLIRYGPVILMVTVFCGLLVFKVHNMKTLVEEAMRVSEVGFTLSLALICFSLIWENKKSPMLPVAKAYALLLGLLVLCSEIQSRLGIVGIRLSENSLEVHLVRKLWMVAWISGLSVMYFAIRKSNKLQLQEVTNDSERVQSA